MSSGRQRFALVLLVTCALVLLKPAPPAGVFAIIGSRLAINLGDSAAAQTCTPSSASNGLSVQSLNGLTPTALANTLVGSGVTISNVTYQGACTAAGQFTGGGGIIGFDSGVILSSGDVVNVVGPNAYDGRTGNNGTAGDADLNTLSGFVTQDAAVLEFDFVPAASQVAFNYVFASEEYNEFAHSNYNDVFAFFVNGVNCALTPDNRAVSINTINNGNPFNTDPRDNPALYRNNDLQDGGGSINTEMDGLTVMRTCLANVNPNVTNHMKLAIADASDPFLDSNVFIRLTSFRTVIREPRNVFGGPGDGGCPECPHSDDPVNLATGNFSHQHTDVLVPPAKGFALTFARAYNSQDSGVSRLGPGWQDSLNMRLLFSQADHSLADVTVVGEFGRQDDYLRIAPDTYLSPLGVFDVLTRNPIDGKFTLRRTDATMLIFDSNGVLLSMADRNNNPLSFSYVDGKLTQVTDASARSLTFTYENPSFPDRITKVTDPLLRTIIFAYNALGELEQVTDVKGGITTYTYDGSHRMTSLRDANNHLAVQNWYDASGRVAEQEDALGGETCIYYGTPPANPRPDCPAVSPPPEPNQTVLLDPLIIGQPTPTTRRIALLRRKAIWAVKFYTPTTRSITRIGQAV